MQHNNTSRISFSRYLKGISWPELTSNELNGWGIYIRVRSPGTAIFTSEKSSKCNGRHHAFGSVSLSEKRSTTSEVEF